MESIMIKERYKVIRALDVRRDYAAAEAVDILDRDKNLRVLNIYEGEYMSLYLDCYDRLHGCSDYRGMFVTGKSLAAVFDASSGENIDAVFYRGAEHDWRTRLKCAEELMHTALSLSSYPPEISCALLLSENIFFDLPEIRVRLRYCIAPMPEANPRELVFLAGDQIKKILLERFESPREELEFFDGLSDGGCKTIVQLYSRWRQERELIEQAYLKLEKKNAFKRWCSLLWKNVKWKLKKRGKGRAQ